MYSESTWNTITIAIKVSIVNIIETRPFPPIAFINPFVARALITNGNVNAEKLG